MVTYKNVELMGLASESLVALGSGLFILPFFLLSPLAGQFSDKFDKSQMIRFTKIWELLLMVAACIGFFLESYETLMALLFLMGVQSTFFGPVKYSIIPELVPPHELVEGNAFTEMGTFLAILLGTIGGGLASSLDSALWVISGSLLLFASLGLFTSKKIPPIPPAQKTLKIQWNPIGLFKQSWRILRQDTLIFYSVIGISWFWFFGAAILSIIPIYSKNTLGGDETLVTTFLGIFTVGIGVGSVLCSRLSFKKVEIGLVPLAALGLTIFSADLFFISPSWEVNPPESTELISILGFLSHPLSYRVLFDFLMISISGGVFIVPLYALLQERSDREVRSQVIASNNVMNALFMVVASLLLMGFYGIDLSLQEIFLVLAGLNLMACLLIFRKVPDFYKKLGAWLTEFKKRSLFH